MLVCNGVSINTIPEIANTLAKTFAKTSSCDNYTPAFQALKRREERVKLNFSSSNEEGYNSPLTLLELRVALHRSDLKIRSAKALNILKVLANTRWGADRTSLLRLYRALIRSKLDCGLQFCVQISFEDLGSSTSSRLKTLSGSLPYITG
ncbi:uncharacterized protein TNCT_212771 [Trichonephila clavata]|uniref:Uncharacterized protein n=1 Tax=Trichonephila clavata TaxID=2740835 RepID=A0A8X6FNH0_TRICU|nr:uncharacterized protein TNCT_212771 [Trichonephila clavata]